MAKNILKQWRLFLNHNLIRDYRTEPFYKYGKAMYTVKGNKRLMKHNPKSDYESDFLKWNLRNSKTPAKVYYEISHFKHIGNMRTNKPEDRILDRLLFDFDNSNNELDEVKKEVQSIVKTDKPPKELINEIKPYQKEYKDIILNSDVLIASYNDCRKLNDFLKAEGYLV